MPVFPVKIRPPHLEAAFQKVDRSQFLDASLRPHAAVDSALPIGHSQTTSQPSVIARMLGLMLRDRTLETVLEIGAGCGYQTAVLSLLCKKVVALERIGALARQTAARMRAMGYNNAHVVHADGLSGYPDAAPYDGIVVCAEYGAPPSAWLEQMSPEGILVMPLTIGSTCRLVAMNAKGEITARRDEVRFVPVLGGKG